MQPNLLLFIIVLVLLKLTLCVCVFASLTPGCLYIIQSVTEWLTWVQYPVMRAI